MRRIPLLALAVLLLSLPCFAQEPMSLFDVSGTYSYVRFEKSNYNGASVSFALNTNRWLGLVADVGGYHQAVKSGFKSSDLVSYLFGPRLSYRTEERITPFAQVLLGGVYDTAISRNTIALSAGGGFDVKIDPHVSLRLAQADYLLTRFGEQTQNSVRLSTGLVFHFGK